MKKLCIIFMITLLSGCVSTPEQVSFNGEVVGTYGPAAGCGTLLLNQDCSQMSGAKRAIEIEGIPLRVAGGEEGKVVFIMSKPMFSPDEVALRNGAEAIKKLMESKGIEILTTKVVYGNGITFGVHYTFDTDGYKYLQELSI
ncbi:hypothetical protein ACJJIF_03025 [Microbulbifer sp. SSSA002]|uniref:hypothetical protein n=1 Tax=unclassified Microbulbifer TaxID=2619833 RepID=UPI00403A0F21